MSRRDEGIESRQNAKGKPRFRGRVFDKGTGRQIHGPWGPDKAAARTWRRDALGALERGELSGDRGPTLREAAEAFVAGIEDGSIRNRSGRTFKPSVVRDYRRDLEQRLVPLLGGTRVSDLRLQDVQRALDRLAGDGLDASSVRKTAMALRSLLGWCKPRGWVRVDPCDGLRLAAANGRRMRIASPSEAALLISALAPGDRQALALACYAGLRAGEILALDWEHVDLERGMLRVERAWDHSSGAFIAPKSKAAERDVPIVDRLRLHLTDPLWTLESAPGEGMPSSSPAPPASSRAPSGLLFPASTSSQRPLSHSGLLKRMYRTWDNAKLERLSLHEGRHTFASICIAAGCNAKAISTYMGHGSISITFDRYGHLMPGSEVEVRGLIDTYLGGE